MPIPSWFHALETATKRLCKQFGVNYVNATAQEIQPVHAAAERELGEEFAKMVRKERG